MKNIVETIQKEQDIIIRDTENELLIVQGVAEAVKHLSHYIELHICFTLDGFKIAFQ